MKFTCNKEELDKQLSLVSRIVAIRQTMPILSNILLETDKNILRISGTDLEMAITTSVKADVAQEGTFTVPAKLFQEFVHQNPDSEIEFTLESFDLICKSKKVNAKIPGIDAEEYPQLPKVEESKRVNLQLLDFCEVMKKVVVACASDQTRPVLTGVYMLFNDDTATCVATDSFRLVEKKMKIVPVAEPFTLLIPARTVSEIIRISQIITEDDLVMEISGNQVVCKIGGVEIYSRLLEGNFPKYQNIIPKKFPVQAEVATIEMTQALRLLSVFAQGGSANVLIEITEKGEMELSTYGNQRGQTKNSVYALINKDFTPMQVAFNAKFLLDSLSVTGSDHVKLSFSGQTSAMTVTTDDPNLLELVMPIRL